VCTHQQINELVGIKDRIRESKTTIVAIGNGTRQQAHNFLAIVDLDPNIFELYVDTQLQSYKAFELHKSFTKTFVSAAWIKLFTGIKAGIKVGLLQGDALQQGGTFVIGPGNQLLFAHCNSGTGDHAGTQRVIQVLKS